MSYQIIGNTVVEWEDDTPLAFSITGEVGPKDRRVSKTVEFDFTDLRKGFAEEFLEALKKHFIECVNRLSLTSIDTDVKNIQSLLLKMTKLENFEEPIAVIDEAFLLCLGAEKSNFNATQLQRLKSVFTANPQSSLFQNGLTASDFPTHTDKRGLRGRRIDNILAVALTRASVAHILNVCDNAYINGLMDIRHYSFVYLAFSVFARPNSYRQIRVDDLVVTSSGQYFINIVASKTGEAIPSQITYGINERVGVLLAKQRQNVVETYGHLVAPEDVHKLALFPYRRLIEGGSQWLSSYANENYGMYSSGPQFAKSFPTAIKQRFFNDDEGIDLHGKTLRHTMGTLLAQAGSSSTTIQAALKHATPDVAHAYVDIAFHGMMEELSEAMRPAFEEHLPALLNLNFVSQDDAIPMEKQIQSFDAITGKLETTGECGKSIACENAPMVCYACPRFIPCLDADHSINLRIAEQGVEEMRARGKPFQHLVDRATNAKNHIFIVMNAIELHRQTMEGAQQ